ncbi:hypothetical protein PIB30_032569 [Stylosanthes scabra]|uniref:Uncharacterized protein n=1 Tax=Stylosanthes scabra TaxID=79078 RepID=A0ABU6RCI8_9FABA|nr:hypothetical protein [Stylosanthes scabra]
MRRRFWKRKQEPVTEESPKEDSTVLESTVNNSVQPLEDGSSAGSEFQQENCEIQPMNVEFRPLNSDLRPDNSTIRPPRNDYPGSEEYNRRQIRDLKWLAIFLCIIVIGSAYVVSENDEISCLSKKNRASNLLAVLVTIFEDENFNVTSQILEV